MIKVLSVGDGAYLVIIFAFFNWQIGMNLKFVRWIHPIVLTKFDEEGCKIVHKTNENRRALLLSHLLSK